MIKSDLHIEPGHYAVIFASERPLNPEGYAEMDEATMEAASQIDGYLGYEVVRQGEAAIFISYWRDQTAVGEWARHPLHKKAKEMGNTLWYDAYRSLVCQVQQSHLFFKSQS